MVKNKLSRVSSLRKHNYAYDYDKSLVITDAHQLIKSLYK